MAGIGPRQVFDSVVRSCLVYNSWQFAQVGPEADGHAGKLSVWGAQGLGTPAQAEATKVKEDGGGDICFGIQKKH